MTTNCNDIGTRIKRLREIINIGTQSALARALDCTPGYISKLEQGLNVPSRKLLTLISARFGVNREWLETGKGPFYNDAGLARQEEGRIKDEFVDALREYANGLREMSDFLNSLIEKHMRSKQ